MSASATASAAAEDKSKNSLHDVFQQKYLEFLNDLRGAVPEQSAALDAAAALSPEERIGRFVEEVLPSCPLNRSANQRPEKVLPGVTITEAVWEQLSDSTKEAIQKYLTLLTFCSLQGGMANNFAADAAGGLPNREWFESFLGQWKDKLSSIDFEGLSSKFADIFKSTASDFPKMAEKLLKGHLAKLAQELVSEFTPEDFGLTAEEILECEKNPAKTFELLTDIYTRRPDLIQKAIGRIGNRLQEKIRRGELSPEQIVAEAEELMKQFSENTALVELMENFRNAFGFGDDIETAREAGREGDARRNIVKERLRKKLAAKKAAGGGAGAGGGKKA